MSKIRKSARGQDCQVRIYGVCNHNPETTVLAHLNGGGMGMKHPDIFGAWCCSSCHDVIDGRVKIPDVEPDIIQLWFYEGVFRTQKKLLESGLIKIS
jgi:hypothetical protein